MPRNIHTLARGRHNHAPGGIKCPPGGGWACIGVSTVTELQRAAVHRGGPVGGIEAVATDRVYNAAALEHPGSTATQGSHSHVSMWEGPQRLRLHKAEASSFQPRQQRQHKKGNCLLSTVPHNGNTL